MSGWRACIDESYDDEWFVTAGVLAKRSEWSRLLLAWNAALREAPDPIPFFSQKEVGRTAHADSPFFGWSASRVERKARLLYRAMSGHARNRIVVAFEREDMEVIDRAHLDSRYRSPYLIGFIGALDAVCGFMDSVGGRQEKPAFVFDNWSDPRGERRAVRVFEALARSRPKPHLKWLAAPPRFMHDKGQGEDVDIGLQIADVVAWHYRDTLRRSAIKSGRVRMMGRGISFIRYQKADMVHLKNFLDEYARTTGDGRRLHRRTPWPWEERDHR